MPVVDTLGRMPESINGIPTLYWILIFAAAIIGILIVLFIVYYIIYKIRINKSLEDEKRIGRPLITPLGIVVASGVVVWIASTVFIIAMLHLLTSLSAQTDYYTTDNYRNTITLSQKIDQQNITYDYTTKIGAMHADTKTVDMTISLETRIVLGKDDKLTFRIGDSKTELKTNEDGRYTGTVQVSVFTEAPTGILTLETDGEKISQFIATTPLIFTDISEWPETVDAEVWRDLFPHAEFDTTNVKVSKDGEKTRLEGSLVVLTFCAEEDASAVFTDLSLMLDVDGRVFRQIDLTDEKSARQSGDTYICTLDDTVESGEIDYYLLAKDAQGYSYKIYNENRYILNSDEYTGNCPTTNDITSETEGTYSTITDKDGKIIKRFVSY